MGDEAAGKVSMTVSAAQPQRWFEAYLFDLDGTIYLGESLLPTVARTLDRIDRKKLPIRYLSNNPTSTPRQYVDKLERLGIRARESQIVTSAVATARWLREHHPGRTVYPIGAPALETALAAEGCPLSSDPAEIDIVLASYDRSFTYAKLQIAFDALWYHERAILVSTNPDRYCPMPGGRGEPDTAAIVAAIEACTGVTRAANIGKPNPNMAHSALADLAVDPASCVMVGDRLSTDIAMAHAAGVASALVLTGDSQPSDLDSLPHHERPHVVLNELEDVLPAGD